jgi:PKD repeat protein
MKILLPRICGLNLFVLLTAFLISIPGYADSGPGTTLPGRPSTLIIDAEEENQLPVLSNIETQSLFYSIGAGAIVISQTIEVSDPDNVNLISATVAISSNYNRYQDRLRYTSANNIKGEFNSTTGILKLSGESSLASYQEALRSVKYENTNTTKPNTSDRKVEFTVYDGNANSKVASRSISFKPSAIISGGGDLCGSWQKATIAVGLTGKPSWKITIRRSGGPLPIDTTISNINITPYKFASNVAGTYTLLNVSDKNFTTGTVSGTAEITHNLTPKATISGIDTACPGNEVVLNIQLEGTSPFSITYLCDGANAKTVNNITETNYSLKVVGSGIYTLSAVSDPVRSGCVSGEGTVRDYPVPSAVISGSTAICENTPTNLRVNLTGIAPWVFSYRKNAEAPALVANVTSSPYDISVSKPGTYTLVNVSDINCTGTGSGSAVVTVKEAPEVSIMGLLPAYKYDTGNILITGVPAGGIFSGRGIYTSEGLTYFFPIAAGPGVHNIVYVCQDANTLCYGYDTVQVAVLLAEATVTLPNNDKRFYCFNDPPFTVRADNIENTTGSFSISGGVGLVDNRDNSATVFPSQFSQGGSYTIYYNYQRQGVWMNVQVSFEIEYVTDIFFIEFNKTAYCDNENEVKLNGNRTDGVFSGRAVYGSISTGYYFDPTLSTPGPDTVFYAYTTSRGCNLKIFKALTILDAPDISFIIQDSCIDSEGKDSTAFINLTPASNVTEWLWDFNDNSNNTSALKNPKHLYADAGIRNVQLQAKTSQNCVSKRGILFSFGDEPFADFKWENECYHEDQPIKFINISQIDSRNGIINFNKWEFVSGQQYDSSLTQNASYFYDAPGDYEVTLYVRSNYGCADTIHKMVHIRPTYELQEESSYFEGFESGMAGWGTGTDTPGVNSWTLGEPHGDSLGNGFLYAKEGKKVWYTRFTPVQAYKEQSSYVTSPCYSFRGIRRPMIKFDIWRLFNYNRDGANLQYTADSGKHWYNIGGLEDGINWYNAFDIEGNPGGYSVGWSNIQDKDWVEARHSLDKLNGMDDIQFRFTYGSDGTAKETFGLAFDNLWIGERNKTLLIEHFTSTNSREARSADSTLNRLANSYPLDIIDIQYHTSFLGADPFNEQNQVDPRTRASYYQLSTVPVSILNGGTESDYIFDYSERKPDATLVKKESLNEPLFNIRLQTIRLANSLDIVAMIRPLDTVLNRPITLHIAIIERKISGIAGANGDTLFESVLKTLLPDTSFSEDWYPGQSAITVSRNWNYKNTYNTDEVRVVAFLQDENTREIFQAAIDQYDLPTAINDDRTIHRSVSGTGFTVFPNPAHNEVCIDFDEVTDKKAKAGLFDIRGRLFKSCDLFPGVNLYRMPLEDCPDGIYFLRITDDNQFIGLQKLVISR